MASRPTVVFSRTLTTLDWPGARIYGGDAVQEVTRLKSTGDGPTLRTTGSLSPVRQLLAAGVVDRLRLVTFPLLAGPAGREPALTGAPSVDLQLITTSVLDGRIHVSEYQPTGRDIPRGAEQREPVASGRKTHG